MGSRAKVVREVAISVAYRANKGKLGPIGQRKKQRNSTREHRYSWPMAMVAVARANDGEAAPT